MMKKANLNGPGCCRHMPKEPKLCTKLIVVIMALFGLIACGESTPSTDTSQSESGSISFNVIWAGGPSADLKNHARALPDNCAGISTVEATVLTEDLKAYKGGPWPCTAHKGIISNVPVGQNRSLVLIGRNNTDEIVYYGNKSGIQVLANIENSAGDVIAEYSMPEPSLPENGGIVTNGNVMLQWSAVAGAADYYFVVADDFDFNNIILDASTFNTSYTLTSLSADTTYYWYVVARYGEEDYGLETDEWSFSTPDDYTPGGLPAPAELYTNPADGKIRVTWSAVEGAEGYYLYYREAASVETVQPLTTENADEKIPLSTTDFFYEHTDLTNGHVYSYAISSFNTAGESDLTAQEDLIPAWSNTYQPSLWKKTWVSTILGVNPSVEVNNEDWYVIDVKDNLQLIHVKCLFTHADGDIDMQLYDAAGYSVTLAESLDDNETIDHLSEYGGLFYIRVFTNGPSTSYDLQWTTSLNAIAVPGDYLDLQEAIIAATHGDIILVADGAYTPSDADGFDFMGKAITVRSENGPEGCIIDGDDKGRGFYFHSGEVNSSVVSGFTITGGNINTGLGGGGILCEGASPTISNCIIRNNMVESIAWGGGGISCVASAAPDITNCVINNNFAIDAFGGGGVYIENASPVIRNCTIVNNSAGAETGGGIYLFDSTTEITNSIFWGNSPDQIDNDSVTTQITFSNIQDGSQVDGNINVDPLFASDPIYSLSSGSPCIDAGTPSGAPSSDIEGNPRPVGAGYDMGAYESQ